MDIEGQIITIPRSGLVGEFLLDGNVLDTNDGTKVTATATNVTYGNTTIGYQKQYGIFNGTNAYVSSPSVIADGASTTCGWVYMNANPAQNVEHGLWYFFNQVGAGSKMVSCLSYTYVSSVYRIIAKASNSSTTTAYYDVNLVGAGWNFIALTNTASNGTQQIYFNGVPVGTTGTQGTGTSNNTGYPAMQIGRAYTTNDYTNAFIQSVRSYNRALSQREIEALYLEGKRKLGNAGYPDLFNGCVAYYDFKGDANDVIGGYNGTVTGAALTTDRFGIANSAYSFNGSSDYITTSAAVTTGTSATFSFWLYKTNDNDQCFFIEEAYSNNSMLFFDNAQKKINYRFGATNMISTAANPVTNNTWNHISVTHTGTTGTIYINGVQAVQGTVNAKTGSGTALTLGRLTATLYFFNGYMSDVKVMSVAMSADQVKAEYQASLKSKIYPFTRSLPLNLRNGLLLHLDGTVSGTTAYDQSGAGLNFTTTGTPTAQRILQNKSFILNGSSQYVFVTNDGGVTGGAITMSIFLRLSSEISSSYFCPIAQGDFSTQVNNAILYDYGAGTRKVWFYRSKNSVGDQYATYDLTLGTSKYYHIVYSYDGTTIRGYINGCLVASVVASGNGTSNTYLDKISIGSYTSNTLLTPGSIINPIIWNRALTGEEVQQLFHTLYNNT